MTERDDSRDAGSDAGSDAARRDPGPGSGPGSGSGSGDGSSESNESNEDKEFQSRSQGAVYQGAFEAVMAIPIAGLAGYWLDGYFGTEPVLLLTGFGVGFASFVVRLLRLGRRIQETQRQSTARDPARGAGREDESTDRRR